MSVDIADLARRFLLAHCVNCRSVGRLCDACRDHLEHREQVAA